MAIPLIMRSKAKVEISIGVVEAVDVTGEVIGAECKGVSSSEGERLIELLDLLDKYEAPGWSNRAARQ